MDKLLDVARRFGGHDPVGGELRLHSLAADAMVTYLLGRFGEPGAPGGVLPPKLYGTACTIDDSLPENGWEFRTAGVLEDGSR